MRYLCFLLILIALLSGCAAPESPVQTQPFTQESTIPETEPPATLPPDPVEELLSGMSVEEKVGQLFLARFPESGALEDLAAYHLGGYILFGRDFAEETPESLTETLESCQSAANIPLLIAVDEEGGTVCRVSKYTAFRHSPFPSPRTLYDQEGLDLVLAMEVEKAYLLSSLGINVNMAPVCDIATDPGAFMYSRSLGQSPEITGQFAAGTVEILSRFHVGSVLKHFPGYGSNADTHTGIAVDNRSLEELESCDLIPFAMGIEAGSDAILVGHILVNAFDTTLPVSLSPVVHAYLRQNMGFDGVILTDDLAMDAINDQYGAGEAAVLAILAGNDLLCSTEYPVQYEAVLDAVSTGRISPELLDAAVTRVLRWKQELGLLG